MAIERELLDQNGLVDELKKALSERILNAELDEHLEEERNDGNANRRNGHSKKSVLTGTSKMTLSIPRDRPGTFGPRLIAKYQRRFTDHWQAEAAVELYFGLLRKFRNAGDAHGDDITGEETVRVVCSGAARASRGPSRVKEKPRCVRTFFTLAVRTMIFASPSSLPSRKALRTELGLGDAEVVITVTRMTRQKGFPALLNAAAIVHRARPNVRFVLVGPRESEGSLAVSEAEIAAHSPYVIAVGARRDVPALLRMADVFAFPTEYREGVARVLLEASLARLPVIS